MGNVQCPKCKGKEIKMSVDKETLIAQIICQICGFKSEEFQVKPANDEAKSQVGYDA